MHVSMMRLKFCHGPTDKAILGVGWSFVHLAFVPFFCDMVLSRENLEFLCKNNRNSMQEGKKETNGKVNLVLVLFSINGTTLYIFGQFFVFIMKSLDFEETTFCVDFI